MPVLPAVPSTMTPPGLSFPSLFGILDDGEGGAIFHRAARIEEFRLAVDIAARHFGRGAQLDQRRIADAIDETRPDVHDVLALLDPAFAPGGTVDREEGPLQPSRTGWRHNWPRIRMNLSGLVRPHWPDWKIP